MLFSSIVFMSKTFRGQWISVVLIFVLKLDIASNTQIPNDNVPNFDSNFGSFLRDLGSMVYKFKKTDVSQNEIRSSHSTHSTPSYKNYRRNQIAFNTQKAILEDVLMMKLVSYYEDKYKLSHLEPTTTESITIANVYTKTRLNNSYKYNNMDKDEVLNTDPKPTKQVQSDANRRMQSDMKKMDQYQVPEVVIF